MQKKTLSPKHCSHHGQRPSPTPHLHTLSNQHQNPCRNRPDLLRTDTLRMPTRLTHSEETVGMQLQGLPVQKTETAAAAAIPLDERSASVAGALL
ncbi:hypothetical protein CesoFtcFv8_011802 [Champsocephalus esox]|uniref:Uncharacterized protein n=1 Tax=Champsocephalus esox TaxID=159716 RepID=A0AAN8C0C1_9TELE|nr:hypothetical protein CesoFtcFv8_011802 [Champsocephalus esox]